MSKLQLKENTEQGILITFCGLDGSGKTSMIRRLEGKLKDQGIVPCLTKQPTTQMRQTPIFRNYMDSENHEAYEYRALSMMAAADRIQHTNHVIVPWLKEGRVVISDRYFYSCLANLKARGYSGDEWIYEIAHEMPKPALSFFMDVSVEKAVNRVRQRKEEKDRYIDMDMQYRLREQYLEIARNVEGIVISTEQNEEDCFAQVWGIVAQYCAKQLDEERMKKVSAVVKHLLSHYSAWEGEIQEDLDIEQDLGMDSLKRVQFVCDIEKTLDFEFDIQYLSPDKFRNVGLICRTVKACMEQRSGS